jgi:hypothetical protein
MVGLRFEFGGISDEGARGVAVAAVAVVEDEDEDEEKKASWPLPKFQLQAYKPIPFLH